MNFPDTDISVWQYRISDAPNCVSRTQWVTVAAIESSGRRRGLLEGQELVVQKWPHLASNQVKYAGPSQLPLSCVDVL